MASNKGTHIVRCRHGRRDSLPLRHPGTRDLPVSGIWTCPFAEEHKDVERLLRYLFGPKARLLSACHRTNYESWRRQEKEREKQTPSRAPFVAETLKLEHEWQKPSHQRFVTVFPSLCKIWILHIRPSVALACFLVCVVCRLSCSRQEALLFPRAQSRPCTRGRWQPLLCT